MRGYGREGNWHSSVLCPDFAEYCDNYPELARARRDFDDFVADRGYMVTEEELPV